MPFGKGMSKMREKIKTLLSMPSIRYTASSLFAFGIEYALVLVMPFLWRTLLPDYWIGEDQAENVVMPIAWLISSNVNFFVNRTMVFYSKDRVLPAYLKYFALALPVFLIKSFGLVKLLLNYTPLPMWVAYPAAQTAMFIVTYIIQKKLIFKLKKKKSEVSDET